MTKPHISIKHNIRTSFQIGKLCLKTAGANMKKKYLNVALILSTICTAVILVFTRWSPSENIYTAIRNSPDIVFYSMLGVVVMIFVFGVCVNISMGSPSMYVELSDQNTFVKAIGFDIWEVRDRPIHSPASSSILVRFRHIWFKREFSLYVRSNHPDVEKFYRLRKHDRIKLVKLLKLNGEDLADRIRIESVFLLKG